MNAKPILFAALLIWSAAVGAKSTPPPLEPTQHPNWGETAGRGVEMVKSQLIDPGSAQTNWTSGFQWGYIKHIFGKRQYGWIACGNVNAKNRLGGYAGAEGYLVFIDASGTITATLQTEWLSTCDSGPFVAVQPEVMGAGSQTPAGPAPAMGVADELRKLAKLRDDGIISEQEFQAQKAKLLGH